MHRRYNRYHSRFDQPDPYDGSYDPADPQSLNRYAYVQNDPVNFIDPSGLNDSFIWSGGTLGEESLKSDSGFPLGLMFWRYLFFTAGGGGGGGDNLGGGGGGAATPQKPAKVCPPTGKQLANDPTVQSAALLCLTIQVDQQYFELTLTRLTHIW
jgi:hypothetical protein